METQVYRIEQQLKELTITTCKGNMTKYLTTIRKMLQAINDSSPPEGRTEKDTKFIRNMIRSIRKETRRSDQSPGPYELTLRLFEKKYHGANGPFDELETDLMMAYTDMRSDKPRHTKGQQALSVNIECPYHAARGKPNLYHTTLDKCKLKKYHEEREMR